MNQDLKKMLLSYGASDAGYAEVDDGPAGLPFAISVAVHLSDAVIDEIALEPTYTYFNHYRSVNYLIDQILLRSGLWLGERGARWITVAASQSRPDSPFEGRYSHKKAACLARLGQMGRNGLFLHSSWGPRVRLGTLFTDWTEVPGNIAVAAVTGTAATTVGDAGTAAATDTASGDLIGFFLSTCATCGLCIAACPAHALDGDTVNAGLCSAWMKKNYQHIGRGVVCGLCMQICPAGSS